jgi:hypothetical protein
MSFTTLDPRPDARSLRPIAAQELYLSFEQDSGTMVGEFTMVGE